MLGSSPEQGGMMMQTIMECLEPQLEEIRRDLQQLRSDLYVLPGDIEQKCSGSCLQEVDPLYKDFLALRDFSQKNSNAIWKQMAHILEQIPKGDSPPRIKEEENPITPVENLDYCIETGNVRRRE